MKKVTTIGQSLNHILQNIANMKLMRVYVRLNVSVQRVARVTSFVLLPVVIKRPVQLFSFSQMMRVKHGQDLRKHLLHLMVNVTRQNGCLMADFLLLSVPLREIRKWLEKCEKTVESKLGILRVGLLG